MTPEQYLELRSGANVRGVAIEGVENEPVTLTAEAVEEIAKAFCVWLISRTGKTKVCVAVGYDARLSSSALCDAVVQGILSTGHDAVVTGLSTTPSMYTLLRDPNRNNPTCDGSIMITASHHPYNQNGMKFFSVHGALQDEDTLEILNMASTYRYAQPGEPGTRTDAPYLDEYAVSLVNMVRQATGSDTPLFCKKILVDAGNGVCGFFARHVLEPLGADTTGSQFLEPDGTFPNHTPNSDDADAIASLCQAVKNTSADLGILFNADGNKACLVDKNGEVIHRNRLIALISAILLEERTSTIITDSITSNGLTKFILAHGGRHYRFKCGHKNIVHEAVLLNALGEYTPVAIETTGHVAFSDNNFLDDGTYLVVRILSAFAKLIKDDKDITDLVADLETPVESLDIRLPFLQIDNTEPLSDLIIQEYYVHASKLPYANPAEENYEGCRANYDEKHGDGWAMIRQSLHSDLAIRIESNSAFGAIKMAKDLYYFLKAYPFLDISPLKDTIDAERQRLMQSVKQNFYSDANYLNFIFGEKIIEKVNDTADAVPATEIETIAEGAPETASESVTEDATVIAPESATESVTAITPESATETTAETEIAPTTVNTEPNNA